MVHINDCFYLPEKQGLFLVTGFIEKSIKIKTLYKAAPGSNNYYYGYYSKGDMVCHPAYLVGERLLRAEIFFRIEKLLELNYLVCKTLITNAEKLITSNTKVLIAPYYLLLNNKCGDINITKHSLFITKRDPANAIDYIDEKVYQKIKTNFDNTIKLIDELWPK